MLVPVVYTGPKDRLPLHVTTDPIEFVKGEETLVPEALLPFLSTLSGHGFTTPAPAPLPEKVEESGVAVVEKPKPASKKRGNP